jgi:Flp pilus assembly pilin Flp
MNLFILKTWLEAKLIKDERGANLVEYILLVAFIAIVLIVTVTAFKDKIKGKFDSAGGSLS